MFQLMTILIVLFIFFLLFVNLRIEINFEKGDAYIDVRILKFIKIMHTKLNEIELNQVKEKSANVAKEGIKRYIENMEIRDIRFFLKNVREFLNKVKYEKIKFELNINFDDYIINSYVIAFINSVVAMLISKNIDKINIDNLDYIITSNENKTKLNLKCIMYTRIANSMFVMLKVAYYAIKLKKRGNDKDGKRTSNRKFNGNSNVIARSNG